MAGEAELKKALGLNNYDNFFRLVSLLRRREIVGSYSTSRATAEFFRTLISSCHWKHTKDGITVIHQIGNIITQAQPIELCLGNIIRRVLFFIREAYAQYQKQHRGESYSAFTPTLQDLLTFPSEAKLDDVEFKEIKGTVLEEINGLIDELNSDTLHGNIAAQSLDHIHANEIIMTYGRSNTVIKFFIEAARKRKFHVVVAEAAPYFKGASTAKILASAGIDTTLITDSAIFCMMSRVNTVIVGTNAVLANGGLLAVSGVRLLAEAAKFHSVPFMVCSGMYKLSPVYPSNRDMLNGMSSPSHIMPFEELDDVCKNNSEGVVINPDLDYIPPNLVSLFLTNYGVHNPSYIYRLLTEYYSLEDYTFKTE